MQISINSVNEIIYKSPDCWLFYVRLCVDIGLKSDLCVPQSKRFQNGCVVTNFKKFYEFSCHFVDVGSVLYLDAFLKMWQFKLCNNCCQRAKEDRKTNWLSNSFFVYESILEIINEMLNVCSEVLADSPSNWSIWIWIRFNEPILKLLQQNKLKELKNTEEVNTVKFTTKTETQTQQKMAVGMGKTNINCSNVILFNRNTHSHINKYQIGQLYLVKMCHVRVHNHFSKPHNVSLQITQ